jgi:tRNA (Thr-GGU) A37 N-methylase
MTDYTVRPIGYVRSSRKVVEDDGWDAIPTRIELDPKEVTPDSTLGLDTFSHAEVVFLFDRVPEGTICRGSRHPRNREDWPVTGILAHRAKDRPNRIGLTTCKIVSVDGLTIEVSGLDAIDGTPVLDVKPFMSAFTARGDVREPEWAAELAAEYW